MGGATIDVSAGGVRVHVETFGSGPPVVLLHGFAGDGPSMGDLGRALPGRAVLVDLVGHGSSDAPAEVVHYTMASMVRHLEAVLDRLEVVAADFVGYSMGGRTALTFAVANPDRVASLCLIGGTAGIAEPELAAARVSADERLAELLEADGIEEFVDHWESRPIFATQARLPAEQRRSIRARRLRQRPTGLANHLRGAGTGAMPSLWGELAHLDIPVLLIAGELDTKFVDIARQMHSLLPGSEVVVAPGVGHAAHLESPDLVAAAISAFIEARARS